MNAKQLKDLGREPLGISYGDEQIYRSGHKRCLVKRIGDDLLITLNYNEPVQADENGQTFLVFDK